MAWQVNDKQSVHRECLLDVHRCMCVAEHRGKKKKEKELKVRAQHGGETQYLPFYQSAAGHKILNRLLVLIVL